MKLLNTKGGFDRKNIMTFAHVTRRERGVDISAAMRMAWAEARRQKRQLNMPAIAPQRLPLEAAAMGAVSLLKKLKDSKIEVGLRVHVQAGVRVTPKGEEAKVWATEKTLSAVVRREPASETQLRLR